MARSMVVVAVLSFLLYLFASQIAAQFSVSPTRIPNLRPRLPNDTLCAHLIHPAGYPCSEHTVETRDGYLLALQRVSSSTGNISKQGGPPVLLQHGLFLVNSLSLKEKKRKRKIGMSRVKGGDVWFLDSPEQSLGFILADHGFDVWVGNVRGTRWSHGHISLSEKDKDFWDWSWQELALHDLADMIRYINSITKSKIFVVGHSQGTIMSLAAFTQPDIVEMVEAAALLCPISYLGHITAPFVRRMVNMHLDQMILAMGIHELNFRRF
uniref:Partial AB-hydrolase lipase domain-containing protein n=1 Tax=Fagus sylvatica TaxID=28930 RepID=A0A2N9H2M4_FAGSY